MSSLNNPSGNSNWKGWPLFFCGICMGAADLVPGISGGTIAFIMGFYNQLLDSIKSLNAANFKLLFSGQVKVFFKVLAWPFLLTLLAGICFAFVTLASFFHYILEHETYRIYLYSAFLGLILASFSYCIRQIKAWKFNTCLGLLVGIVTAFIFTSPYFSIEPVKGPYAVQMELNESVELTNYDKDHQLLKYLSGSMLGALTAKQIISHETSVYNVKGENIGIVADFIAPHRIQIINFWLVFCGAVAICALLLPGISGSYILSLLGVYPLIIGALADLIHSLRRFSFDFDSFYILFSLGIGILIGLLSFTRLISWLLKSYHDFTIAVLCGCMIGALRSVWPWWSIEYTMMPLKMEKGPQLVVVDPLLPSLTSPLFYQACFFILAGFFLVLVIEKLSRAKHAIVSSNLS